MIELNEAPDDRKKSFQCSVCPASVKALRRCAEDRENFTDKDNGKQLVWPMQVSKGGELYSFCPAKATWDSGIVRLYQSLVISAETGIMYESGPLSEQPAWWIDLLHWFIPMYKSKIFWSRADSIMDSMNPKTKA